MFKEDGVQRVSQYLKRFDNDAVLDKFVYSTVEGKPMECLSIILKYIEKDNFPCNCNNSTYWFKNRMMSSQSTNTDFDPSWSEVRNFITFLDAQLRDCEDSIFCKFGGDDLKGFKQFIVRFSIEMAKV